MYPDNRLGIWYSKLLHNSIQKKRKEKKLNQADVQFSCTNCKTVSQTLQTSFSFFYLQFRFSFLCHPRSKFHRNPTDDNNTVCFAYWIKAATSFANETTLAVCLAMLACWLSAADALTEVCIECLAFESTSDITAGEPLSLPASFRSSLLLLMHHYSPCQCSCTGSNRREKGETNHEQSRTMSTNVAWSLIWLTAIAEKKSQAKEELWTNITHIIIQIMYIIFYTQTISLPYVIYPVEINLTIYFNGSGSSLLRKWTKKGDGRSCEWLLY